MTHMNSTIKLKEIQVEAIDLNEYESQPRQLGARENLVIGVIAIALSVFQLYTSWVGSFDDFVQRSIHIAFVFTILFTTYPSIRRGVRRNEILWIDWTLIILSLICTLWVAFNSDRFFESPTEPNTIDLILGTFMILLVLEGARRVLGPALPIIGIILIFYAMLGPYIPGRFMHRGFSFEIFIANLYTNNLGLWGFVTGISATVIAGFLIFGVLLEKTEGGKIFVKLAMYLAGKSHGGPAKVSCFSSALFGTISGSAVANVVVDGVFNIPLMKRLGYKKAFAAAVEATASTGGQVLPPIMGAGAFVMAEILAIPYKQIAIAAAIPAGLFYLGCLSGIHFEAQRLDLKPLPSEMIPSFRKDILPGSLSFILPVLALIYLLANNYSPSLSIFYSILIAVGWYIITARNRNTLRERIKLVIASLDAGGRAIVMVAALCICAQLIVSLFNTTGLGVKVSELIIDWGQGDMFITLILAMILCLILGMGVPTTAAYVLAVSVAGPALISLGSQPLSSHLFIFYFAIISAITPPVCAAVYVSSAIAGSNWWKTAWIACRLGLSGFIIPFMFFYAPTLLCFGDLFIIVVNSTTAAIGVGALSAGVMGFLVKKCSLIERLFLVVSAFLMIDPGYLTDIVGLVIICSIYMYQRFKVNRTEKTEHVG